MLSLWTLINHFSHELYTTEFYLKKEVRRVRSRSPLSITLAWHFPRIVYISSQILVAIISCANFLETLQGNPIRKSLNVTQDFTNFVSRRDKWSPPADFSLKSPSVSTLKTKCYLQATSFSSSWLNSWTKENQVPRYGRVANRKLTYFFKFMCEIASATTQNREI